MSFLITLNYKTFWLAHNYFQLQISIAFNIYVHVYLILFNTFNFYTNTIVIWLDPIHWMFH